MLPLISILLVAPWITDLVYSPQNISLTEDQKKLDSLVALLEKASLKTSQETTKEFITQPLFYFNPNREREDQLEKIFGKKIARTIVRFRAKGGKFTTKTDLIKIYGMDSLTYKRIEKFILLPEMVTKEHIPSVQLASSSQPRLDINKADSLELQGIKESEKCCRQGLLNIEISWEASFLWTNSMKSMAWIQWLF